MRGQIFTILRRMVGLRNEKSGKYGPHSQRRSKFGLSATGAWCRFHSIVQDTRPHMAPPEPFAIRAIAVSGPRATMRCIEASERAHRHRDN